MVGFPTWEVCQLVKKVNKIGWLAALLPDLSWLAAVLPDLIWLGRITDFHFPVGPFEANNLIFRVKT